MNALNFLTTVQQRNANYILIWISLNTIFSNRSGHLLVSFLLYLRARNELSNNIVKHRRLLKPEYQNNLCKNDWRKKKSKMWAKISTYVPYIEIYEKITPCWQKFKLIRIIGANIYIFRNGIIYWGYFEEKRFQETILFTAKRNGVILHLFRNIYVTGSEMWYFNFSVCMKQYSLREKMKHKKWIHTQSFGKTKDNTRYWLLHLIKEKINNGALIFLISFIIPDYLCLLFL